MNFSAPFIRRPVGTILLTCGVVLAGIGGFFSLPVAPLPQVDMPIISVSANIPGASPETMATSVATPLERRLGLISGVNEMTSNSGNGSTRITLQFDLDRDADTAAREVQAAINASRVDLPSNLRSNPTYRKANPAAAPILILALTSDKYTPGQIYEQVSNLIQQRVAQVEGVGDIEIGGGSLPAVRVEVYPFALNRYGISMEDVRAAIQASAANRPKGVIENDGQKFQIYTHSQRTGDGRKAIDYRELIVAWRNGAPVRLQDVAEIVDGVEDSHTLGLFNGKPAVVVLIRQQAGANVIETVDSIKALLPSLQRTLPADIKIQVASDRTKSIRASLKEIEITLLISIVLVVLVVSAFLRNARATFIPALATIVSLLGTFGAMLFLGFSLNNLSLMALTVASGFVVDDAIVVLENTSRHLERGMRPFQAALHGAREVGFTVLSISLSLVAVFIPILFMDGQVGRLFREFAITLSVAVMISLIISLTTTPMLCALLLKAHKTSKQKNKFALLAEGFFDRVKLSYEKSLDWALKFRKTVLFMLLVVVGLNIYLFIQIPKGFFPQQDTGQLNGGLSADESISFSAMQEKLQSLVNIIKNDPAIDTVVGFTGGARAGGGFVFVNLKPASERSDNSQKVIARLRPQLAKVTGVSLFLNQVQDLRMGGRASNSTYQYTLKSDNTSDLKKSTLELMEAMKSEPALTDVDADQQEKGVESFLDIDKTKAAAYGIGMRDIDNALYNSFGQRQVATLFDQKNQYHVIMEVAPQFSLTPDALKDVYVPTNLSPTTNLVASNPALRDQSSGQVLNTAVKSMVPLSSLTELRTRSTATSVNHQDAEISSTISFNIADGSNLADAMRQVKEAEAKIALPANVRGSFQGTARTAKESQQKQPLLILAAILVIYFLLGILYESLIHPITVLSTLPSAGIGAILALQLFNMDFSIIALIGLFLLIGIVKKNAILIIDFAIETQRAKNVSALEAVREACLLRFRPILMTTLAAALGALPLAVGFGEGSELRQPLGITIIGGLIACQLLTLLTTPVVYVMLDKFSRRAASEKHLTRAAAQTGP